MNNILQCLHYTWSQELLACYIQGVHFILCWNSVFVMCIFTLKQQTDSFYLDHVLTQMFTITFVSWAGDNTDPSILTLKEKHHGKKNILKETGKPSPPSFYSGLHFLFKKWGIMIMVLEATKQGLWKWSSELLRALTIHNHCRVLAPVLHGTVE